MPHATTDDGVRLYFEETGSGRPVIFVHEFAGDMQQLRAAAAAFRQTLSCDGVQRPAAFRRPTCR